MTTALASPTSIRLTEIKLPLDHAPQAIHIAVCERLKLKADEIHSVSIFRRGFDARKKSDIHFIYTLDVQTTDNTSVLARAQRAPKLATHTTLTPDTSYKFVTHAPDNCSPSSAETDVGWFANPARYIARNNQSPLRSPVKTRPVRFAPCAAGANPSTTIAALGSPKPEIGRPQYGSLRYAARFSIATSSRHDTNRGHSRHSQTAAANCVKESEVPNVSDVFNLPINATVNQRASTWLGRRCATAGNLLLSWQRKRNLNHLQRLS